MVYIWILLICFFHDFKGGFMVYATYLSMLVESVNSIKLNQFISYRFFNFSRFLQPIPSVKKCTFRPQVVAQVTYNLMKNLINLISENGWNLTRLKLHWKKNNIQTYVHDLTVIFCNQKVKKCSDYVLSSYSFTSRQ